MKPLGGQAIVEGVMIKAPDNVSMAARTPKGKIVTRRERHVSLAQKNRILGLPFLRGIIQLWEMLVIGVKALAWSANQQGEEEELTRKDWFLVFSFAVALTVGLFVLLPYYAAKFFFEPHTITFGFIDGIIRLLVFLGYLVVIGFMGDVRRMFQYHGAEHMSVHCYEHKKALKVENVKHFPPEHPRCGTSLLLFVVAVSIVLFSVVRTPHWYINVPVRIFLIPVIAGISYELLKVSARYSWLKWLTYPGLWVQKLTTRKPTARQIEVAIAAVNKAK
jgi:uncharacterized protein YqhQ